MSLPSIKTLLAVWLGKGIACVNRTLGRGGTSLPGMAALKVDPALIKKLVSQHRQVIVVTGTNGKTTTNNILAGILIRAGYRVAWNRAGANMKSGIATALIENTSLLGKARTSTALLEVDEATVPLVLADLQPAIMVVTNFFRDQLDRYGELDKTVALIAEGAKKIPGLKLILNADDPLVASLAQRTGRDSYFYGVAASRWVSRVPEQVREGCHCPFCSHCLEYAYYHFSQLGNYRCPQCGFSRPPVHWEAVDPDMAPGITFYLQEKEERWRLSLPLEGYYNLYNVLAAAAAARFMGIDQKIVAEAVRTYTPQTGRMEEFNIGGKRVLLVLVKNPAGFNQVLRSLLLKEGPLNMVIAINDLDADGKDVSWLWDVNFEMLAKAPVGKIICTGLRGADMAVRLKYAGIPEEKLRIIDDREEAVEEGLNLIGPGETLYVLPTYTNLFPMSKILSSRQGKRK
ncbi:MAG: hypothetical protein PWQ91_1687 [Eubacteriales bacterium]|nr:hypothetical protein [Eubacteriales bacterium]MDN5364625.1 hypothetical protein [Eubacteriales bacterium]